MDLIDLDGPPTHAPSRVSRFAPKNSKLKPRPRPRPKPETLDSAAAKNEVSENTATLSEAKKEEEADLNRTVAGNGFVKTESEAVTEPKEEVEEQSVSMDMDDDQEDTVVREIDVFFNPRIDEETQLYVFQYPLRPCWRPYELDEQCEEVRVKPGSSEVEIDLSMDFESKNYDQECGTKMKMTKQTLHCAWKEPPVTGYAVGVLMGNKLHLNPIHAAVQLRPSLRHLNSRGIKRKNNISEDTENTVKLEDPSAEKAAGSSKKQNKAANLEQKTVDDECWVPLKYQGSETESSSKYLRRMETQESSPLPFTMSPFDYLNSLCPSSSNKDATTKGPSNKSLLALPLEDRIKKVLCEGPAVHRFNALTYFAPDYNKEEILEVLQRHAMLVQGLWTPKSILLFQQVPERVARDYVLHSFWKSPHISISSLHYPSRIKAMVDSFLDIFAAKRPSIKDWKFKEPSDNSFIKDYPDVVKKQERGWEDLYNNIMRIFTEHKSGRDPKNNQNPKPLATKKAATKGASEVPHGKSIPDDIREVLSSKVLPKVIQDHKVCSFQLIRQGLRDLALNKLNLPKADSRFVKAAEYGTDSPEELRRLLNQVAIEIHGRYVMKSSAEHPQYDPFRNVIINLLLENGPNAKLKKADIYDAAKKALNRDIPNNEYSKVMNEICVFKSSCWILKSGDGNPK